MFKIKGFIQYAWIFVVLILIAVVGTSFTGASLIPGSLVFNGCDIKQSGTVALIPQYGYYSCEITTTAQNYKSKDISMWDLGSCRILSNLVETRIGCPSDSTLMNPNGRCTVVLKNNGGGAFTEAEYRICNGPGNCPAWKNTNVHLFIGYYNINTGEQTLTLSKNQILELRICSVYKSSTIPMQIYEKHDVYGLFNYVRGMKTQLTTSGCNPPIFTNWVDKVLQPLYDVLSYSGVFQEPTGLDKSNELSPGRYRNYLKDWVSGPLEANFFTDTDGKIVDCSANKVYELATISYGTNSCGAFPYKVKRSVNCCPGDKDTLGRTCVINSTHPDGYWISEDQGCIRNGIPTILACDGEGGWTLDTSTERTYKKATSCTSEGVCVYTYKTAPCTAPAIGCPPGAICIIDPFNPDNNYCKAGVLPCGDKNGDCYDDCTYEKLSNECDDNKTACYDLCDVVYPIGITTLGNIIENPKCKFDCWIKEIAVYIGVLIASFMISTGLVFLLRKLPVPYPLNIIRAWAMNPIFMFVIILIFTITIASILSIPIQMATASLIGVA